MAGEREGGGRRKGGREVERVRICPLLARAARGGCGRRPRRQRPTTAHPQPNTSLTCQRHRATRSQLCGASRPRHRATPMRATFATSPTRMAEKGTAPQRRAAGFVGRAAPRAAESKIKRSTDSLHVAETRGDAYPRNPPLCARARARLCCRFDSCTTNYNGVASCPTKVNLYTREADADSDWAPCACEAGTPAPCEHDPSVMGTSRAAAAAAAPMAPPASRAVAGLEPRHDPAPLRPRSAARRYSVVCDGGDRAQRRQDHPRRSGLFVPVRVPGRDLLQLCQEPVQGPGRAGRLVCRRRVSRLARPRAVLGGREGDAAS